MPTDPSTPTGLTIPITGGSVVPTPEIRTPAQVPPGMGNFTGNHLFTPIKLAAVDSSAWDTYTKLIAYLDSTILRLPGVTKTDRGLCANGADRLYEYRAGTGPINVLILCGVHGPELAGTWTMLRWMEQLANPTDAMFTYLSKCFTVSWVPSGNPGSFRGGRKNPNDVDLNRNYPFYWSRYTPQSTDNNKGATALSEPETQAFKAIIDARNIDAVIDCHNYEAGFSTYEILSATGSLWTRANRKHWKVAVDLFNRVYGANSSGFDGNGNLADPSPTMVNWATHYLQNVLGKPHGAATLLECSRDMDGGTLTYMPASGITKYGGYITTWLLTYLQTLASPQYMPTYSWQQRRFTDNSAVSISSGGTLLDQASDVPLTWDETSPGVSVPRNYIDCPVTCAGYLDVQFEGTIESLSANAVRYSIGITLDGGAVVNSRSMSVTSSGNNAGRAPVTCSARFEITTVDANYVPRVQVTVNRLDAAASHNMKRSRVRVVFTPHDNAVNNMTPSF